MNLELKILEYLKKNDKGNFVDVSLIDENYYLISEAINDLQGRNLIVIENKKPRDFEAFGITEKVNSINVKINAKGKEYLYCLNNPKGNCEESSKKRFWKMAYFFG
ncbi:MAG: hypothetical protein ABFR32_04965 [Bacteroidota bacterium]